MLLQRLNNLKDTHPILIHTACVVRLDDVNKTHDVMFGDEVGDDRIHGRIFPDTRRVNQHNTALENMTKNNCLSPVLVYIIKVYSIPRIS